VITHDFILEIFVNRVKLGSSLDHMVYCCLAASHQLDFGTSTSTSSQTHFRTTTSIDIAMFLQRSAIAAVRRAAVTPIIKRTFTSSIARRTSPTYPRSPHLTPHLGESTPTTPATVNGVKIKSFHGMCILLQSPAPRCVLIPWIRD
jgi:hypothetical protein